MTYLIVSGFNYRTSEIGVRERFTVPPASLQAALNNLRSKPCIKEAVILSTCNRTEVYAVVTNVQKGFREIDMLFWTTREGESGRISKPNFKLVNDDVALHLFRLASGLDSLVLGESQIVSQIKSAQQSALQAGAVGPVLSRLFDLALHCSKRVRSETAIGRLAVSMGSAAIDFGCEQLGSLKDKSVAIVGSGRMAQICLKLLTSRGHRGRVISIHRSKTREFGQLEQENRGAEGLWEDRHQLVANADLVIVATSSPDYVLSKCALAEWISNREKPLVIVDISVPRNVEPRVGELADVRLFHTDDLGRTQPDPLEQEGIITQAEKIIFEQFENFVKWQHEQFVAPMIIEWRRKMESIRDERLAKVKFAGNSLSGQDDQNVEVLTRIILNQMMHEPTMRIKRLSQALPGPQLKEVLSVLFDITDKSESFTETSSCLLERR